ncbi:MAG: M24 family metallopeptidase [Thermodesulfobacteriota bacterium]
MMYENRVDKLRARFQELGVDTIWIVQPENRRYLSGFKAPDGQLTESSGSLLITLHEALLITDSRYTTQAEQEVVGFEVVTQKRSLVDTLSEKVRSLGTKRLGFEGGYLVWELFQQVNNKLSQQSPPIELAALSAPVERLREIKEQGELELLRSSAVLMSDVLARVIAELKPGESEKEVAWKIETWIRDQGAEESSFPPIVASGPNSALPHAVPTERSLREGEPIILDVGAKLEGYCSDMTRTVFLGDPSEEVKKIYATVREAQIAAMKAVRPGMKTTEADSIARDHIARAGYGDYFGHSLGHGIGLAPHETPALAPRKPKTLQEGMVFTIEPGIYIPGKGGVRLEEMVFLGSDGAELLTRNNNFYSF